MAILVRHSWWDRLLALVRQLSRDQDVAVLAQCATALRRAGQYGAAKEALLKLDDSTGLAELAVATERWAALGSMLGGSVLEGGMLAM